MQHRMPCVCVWCGGGGGGGGGGGYQWLNELTFKKSTIAIDFLVAVARRLVPTKYLVMTVNVVQPGVQPNWPGSSNIYYTSDTLTHNVDFAEGDQTAATEDGQPVGYSCLQDEMVYISLFSFGLKCADHQ